MSGGFFGQQPRRLGARSGFLIVGGVLVAAVLVLVGVLIGKAGDSGDNGKDSSTSDSDSPRDDGVFTENGKLTREDVAEWEWVNRNGAIVPFSSEHGPRDTSGGRAQGFSRSLVGAVLASINIPIHAIDFQGSKVFEPTIREQCTGETVDAFLASTNASYERLLLTSSAKRGDPVVQDDGEVGDVKGFHVASYNEDAAHIDFLLTEGGYSINLGIDIRWIDNDWRLVPRVCNFFCV